MSKPAGEFGLRLKGSLPPCRDMEYQEMQTERDRSLANAVVRACDVLKAFRHESETLGLVELVERTKLSKTTVFRLLQSLVRGGVVERVGKGMYSSRVRPLDNRTFGWALRPRPIQSSAVK